MCSEAVRREPYMLRFVPDHLIMQEVCNKIMRVMRPEAFSPVPYHFKTQEMCKRVVEEKPRLLKYVPDWFKTKEICDKAVSHDPSSLQFVSDWFVTQQQVKLWHDDDDHCNNEELINWYNGYKKRKAQKAKIRWINVMPFAWHPSRWWDWRVYEEEKKETEKVFLIVWFAEIKNVLIKEDVQIWSKRGYN